jgi:hypothetical protein
MRTLGVDGLTAEARGHDPARLPFRDDELFMEEVPPDLPPACKKTVESWCERADELISRTPPEHRSAYGALLRDQLGRLFAVGTHPVHAKAAVEACAKSERAKLDGWREEALASTRSRQRMTEQGIVFAGGEHSAKPPRPFTGPDDLQLAAYKLTDSPPPPLLTDMLWRAKHDEVMRQLRRDVRELFDSSKDAIRLDASVLDTLVEGVIEGATRQHDRELRERYLPDIADSIAAGDFQLAGRRWTALYMRYSQYATQGYRQALDNLQSFAAQAAREQMRAPNAEALTSALQSLLDQSQSRLDKELYISLAETIATESPEAKRFGSNAVRTVLADAFRAPEKGVVGGAEIHAHLEAKYRALPPDQGYACASYLSFLRSRGLFANS